MIGSEHQWGKFTFDMTGDLMARLDPDYKPIYQALGAGAGKMATGPFTDDILGKRLTMDDGAFDDYWTEKIGLAGLKV